MTAISTHTQFSGGFSAIWQRRTVSELSELAHIKRFMECLRGDPVFRDKLALCIDDNPSKVAKEYGINVDPDLFRPLFHAPYAHYRFAQADSRWPLTQHWDVYCAEIAQALHNMMAAGDSESNNSRFHHWRRRQIARVGFELGDGAENIVHPIAAYELSQGCSIGCWFCGVSADQYKGYYPFTPVNEKNWREMLNSMMQRFGNAAQTGFCYWATDPNDNPDYTKFIKVHGEVTGFIPQTTTAAPLKNLDQTREILQLFNQTQGIWNRFSILSVGQLRKVHAQFSAEELLGVELVLQNTDAMTHQYAVGRATADHKNFKNKQANQSGTVACVSGFLVKPMEHTVELISPTLASETWPNGYRIYGKQQFADSQEFDCAIDQLIESYMPSTLADHSRLAFRADLSFAHLNDGFKLSNSKAYKLIQGPAWLTRVGERINTGLHRKQEILQLAQLNQINPAEVSRFLHDLFQAGFFNEDVLLEKQ